jgi:hypothetical protein
VEENADFDENAFLSCPLKVLFREIGSPLIVWQAGWKLQGVL